MASGTSVGHTVGAIRIAGVLQGVSRKGNREQDQRVQPDPFVPRRTASE